MKENDQKKGGGKPYKKRVARKAFYEGEGRRNVKGKRKENSGKSEK